MCYGPKQQARSGMRVVEPILDNRRGDCGVSGVVVAPNTGASVCAPERTTFVGWLVRYHPYTAQSAGVGEGQLEGEESDATREAGSHRAHLPLVGAFCALSGALHCSRRDVVSE